MFHCCWFAFCSEDADKFLDDGLALVTATAAMSIPVDGTCALNLEDGDIDNLAMRWVRKVAQEFIIVVLYFLSSVRYS